MCLIQVIYSQFILPAISFLLSPLTLVLFSSLVLPNYLLLYAKYINFCTVTLLTISYECWLWYTLLNVRMCAKVTGAQLSLRNCGKLVTFILICYHFIFSHDFIESAHVVAFNLCKLLYRICAISCIESAQFTELIVPW